MSAISQAHLVAQSRRLVGAKLAHRLMQALPAGSLSVFLNTENDLEPLSLHIPPDIDAARHALADLANLQPGWRGRGQPLHLVRALSDRKGGRES